MSLTHESNEPRVRESGAADGRSQQYDT
jgi:hypothetical protein